MIAFNLIAYFICTKDNETHITENWFTSWIPKSIKILNRNGATD